jgi:hypothetical protein
MEPTKSLPQTHTLAWAVDMKKDWRLNLLLQVVGMGWFFLIGWWLWNVVHAMRPDYVPQALFYKALPSLAVILATLFVVLTLHELVHGAFFWIFTGESPKYGIGPGYAYAAAPDWFFPKGQYLIVGLSPLIVLTMVGLVFIAFVPVMWVGIISLGVVFNAGGAIGDLYVCARIAREAGDAWVKDRGDGFEVYKR